MCRQVSRRTIFRIAPSVTPCFKPSTVSGTPFAAFERIAGITTGGVRVASRHPLRIHPCWVPIPDGTPPFARHVGQIARLRREEEMVGPHAGGGIAPVTDIQPFRDRSVSQFPRDAIGDMRAPGRTHRELPVPVRVFRCQPQPARPQFGTMGWDGTVLIDFQPEAFSGRFPPYTGVRRIAATSGAKTRTAPIDLSNQRAERRGAEFAGAEKGGTLSGHREPPTLGVWPPDVSSVAGALRCPHCSTLREWGKI
jgi:hypothetical protein